MNDSLTQSSLTDAESRQLMADAEDLNGAYPDAILLLARYAGGRPEASEAEITFVDDAGITLDVRGSDQTRVAFDRPASSLDEARAFLHALFGRARSLAGDSVPTTSLEREIDASTRLSTFQTSVVDVEDLTPRLRQITFGGGLDDFISIAPDQYLLVTPGHGDDPDAPRAYYTVRRERPNEVDMWFVLHEHGPLSDWAGSVERGSKASLWGPRFSFRPPADTDRLLLVADDTGLAAVAAILEASRTVPARVIIETYRPDHIVELEAGPEVSIDWLFRGDDPAGTGSRLLDAVWGHDLDTHRLYAFGAAESHQMSAVRKHLRHELGMAQSNVHMTGYWRRSTPRSSQTTQRRNSE